MLNIRKMMKRNGAPIVVAILLGIGIVCTAISIGGFLNALWFQMHGPGGNLGIGAGALAAGAFAAAQWVDKRGPSRE